MSPAKKSFTATYIAVGIFALLAAYVYIFERGDIKKSGADVLYSISREEVKKIEISDTAAKTGVTCEKSGEDWKIIKPKQYEIDKSEMDGVVNNVSDPKLERKIAENVADLAPFGLDKPTHKVSVTLKSGKTYTIAIGAKTPAGNSYFIKEESASTVYTAASYNVDYMKKDVKQLRKKTIIDLETSKATKFIIKLDKREIAFSKETGAWMITPFNFPGDKSKIENAIDKIKELKALDFAEDEAKDLKKYGLDRPRLSLTVFQGPDRPPVTLSIGKKVKDKEEDYARREDNSVIYSVSRSFIQDFDKAYNDFRDKTIIEVKADDITEVELDKGGKLISAKKDRLNKFKIEKPVAKLAEAQYYNLLSALTPLTAEKFVDDSGKRFDKYGLNKPRITVTLYITEGQERKLKAKLLIGNDEKKENYFVKLENSGSVFTVRKDLVERIDVIYNYIKAGAK